MNPLRVCCLAYHAYPVIEPTALGAFGGTETRAWMLARGLAGRSEFRVSFVVYSRRPLARDECDGVRIIRRHEPLYWVRQDALRHVDRLTRFPWVRLRSFSPGLLWRLPLLAAVRPFRRTPDPRRPDRFLQRLEADVLCCFGVHCQSAVAVASSKASGRKAVLFLGADSDLDPRYTPDSSYVSPYGERGAVCRYAIDHADRIVVQTPWQQEALRERFGRDSAWLPNPIDLAEWDAARASSEPFPEAQGLARYALWVGRADSFHKRPLVCLDLARRCPEVDFLLIVNPREPAVEARMARECPANVRLVERVPYRRMARAFRDAAVYVNTSAPGYEGFPNVFLQAAASRVPIASLELDYGLVAAQQCGVVAEGNLDRLAEYVRAVWRDARRGEEEGRRGRDYVRGRHDLPSVVDRLAEALRQVCTDTGRTPPH